MLGKEPPYNTWIDHQEWHNRNWRKLGLRIIDYDRETNRIKVAP